MTIFVIKSNGVTCSFSSILPIRHGLFTRIKGIASAISLTDPIGIWWNPVLWRCNIPQVSKQSVGRTDWRVLAFVWMPNHIQVFLQTQTPKPNLSKGMQYLLSSYANWYAKRYQRTGHLFQESRSSTRSPSILKPRRTAISGVDRQQMAAT